MNIKIFGNGVEVNRIVADESFAKIYCERNGYTYEAETETEPEPEPSGFTYTSDDLMSALLGMEVPGNAGGGVL